jgi:hypothetical protein
MIGVDSAVLAAIAWTSVLLVAARLAGGKMV